MTSPIPLSPDVGALEAKQQVGEPLSTLAVPLTREGLFQDYPPRPALLRDSRTGRSVMVRGKVGLFAGKGGVGKSMALIFLAIAIVLGIDWFGFQAEGAGRVLLVLAEEDRDEILRRLSVLCRAMGLTSMQVDAVVSGITAFPLAGHGVALTHQTEGDRGALPETSRPAEFRQVLADAAAEGRPFTLIILDPLSRFAGFDVEKDNAAATRFIQVLETFVALDLGAPAVLIAHHLRKGGQDDDREASEMIRGAQALFDGVRFAMILHQLKPVVGAPDLLRLRVVKSNYTAIPEPLTLCRPQDGNGTLRAATAGEIEAYGTSKGGQVGGSAYDLVSLILGVLESGPASGSEIARVLRRGKSSVLSTLEALHTDGLIARSGRQWRSVPNRSGGSEPISQPVRSGSPLLRGTETGTDPGTDDQ